MTTHDLALTNVVTELRPREDSVFFKDHRKDGRMKFDYIMHDGLSPKVRH